MAARARCVAPWYGLVIAAAIGDALQNTALLLILDRQFISAMAPVAFISGAVTGLSLLATATYLLLSRRRIHQARPETD